MTHTYEFRPYGGFFVRWGSKNPLWASPLHVTYVLYVSLSRLFIAHISLLCISHNWSIMLSLLLLSWNPILPGLSPQDPDQWYQSRYTLHGNEDLSIVWVQRSAGISILLLAHSNSICWAIHCKHHNWFSGTTWYLKCRRKFQDLYHNPCYSTNL